ncbi:hypothetical protein WMY93_014793 [Mugilogobius chulae]|uniref:C-type lectin domain-containing protein n=1 Tax=Mugilogobius chulae TaxID=88201 RepID=A0AAW0NWI0_9GOBI
MENSVYSSMCYRYVPGSFTFQEAENQCRALGAVPYNSGSLHDLNMRTHHRDSQKWIKAWLAMGCLVFGIRTIVTADAQYFAFQKPKEQRSKIEKLPPLINEETI